MSGGEQARQPARIEISSGEVSALVNPYGAYLEQLRVGTVDLLLPRQDMVEGDQTKDRGGVFACFPYFGPGKALGLEQQHGYARKETWHKEVSPVGAVVLSLAADDERFGPYQGLQAQITYEVVGSSAPGVTAKLICELDCKNEGAGPMVLTPGWHPYFPVKPAGHTFRLLSEDRHGEVYGDKLMAGDLGTATVVGADRARLRFVAGSSDITMRNRDLETPIVWSGSPDKYVCVEPTRAAFLEEPIPGSAVLHPHEAASFSTVIEWREGLFEG